MIRIIFNATSDDNVISSEVAHTNIRITELLLDSVYEKYIISLLYNESEFIFSVNYSYQIDLLNNREPNLIARSYTFNEMKYINNGDDIIPYDAIYRSGPELVRQIDGDLSWVLTSKNIISSDINVVTTIPLMTKNIGNGAYKCLLLYLPQSNNNIIHISPNTDNNVHSTQIIADVFMWNYTRPNDSTLRTAVKSGILIVDFKLDIYYTNK